MYLCAGFCLQLTDGRTQAEHGAWSAWSREVFAFCCLTVRWLKGCCSHEAGAMREVSGLVVATGGRQKRK